VKYLLPWREIDNSQYEDWARCEFGSNKSGASHYIVWRVRNGVIGCSWYLGIGGGSSYHTKEDAMKEADYLPLQQGNILIPEDQVERFEKKLKLLL
jgi:uncharacterized protein YodC (DUF2158 family)